MTTVKVTSPAELLDALATADDIDVDGSLTGMPMITLRAGVTLRGGTLRFGAKGVRLTSDNALEDVTVIVPDWEVAIGNDTAIGDFGRLTLRNVRARGQVLLLADGAVRRGHVEVDGLAVASADLRGRSHRPHGFGVDAMQGGFTLWNRQPDPEVRITASLKGISAGTAESPIRGSGVFVAGQGDRAGAAHGGLVDVDVLRTGPVVTDGGIGPGTPDLISGGVFVVSGARVAAVINDGPVTTMGANDMVLDNWGEVGAWTARAPVTSHGPSGIGFVNFGTLDRLDVQAPVQTFGVGARGFNVYDGSLHSARFDSITTHADRRGRDPDQQGTACPGHRRQRHDQRRAGHEPGSRPAGSAERHRRQRPAGRPDRTPVGGRIAQHPRGRCRDPRRGGRHRQSAGPAGDHRGRRGVGRGPSHRRNCRPRRGTGNRGPRAAHRHPDAERKRRGAMNLMARKWVAVDFGGPEVLHNIEVDVPDPGPGQVTIDVRAAGMNPADAKHIAPGQDRALLPLSVGYEVAGVVTAFGPDTQLASGGGTVGDEVVAAMVDGGYTTAITVPASDVFAKPAPLSFPEAASLLLVGTTAADLLHTSGAKGGETVLLHGAAGAVGVSVLQQARLLGVRVVGTASKANFDFVRVYGGIPVEYGPGLLDRVRAAAPEGIAAALDTVGSDEAGDVSLALVADRNRVITIADARRAKTDRYVFVGASNPASGPFRARARSGILNLAQDGELVVPMAQTFRFADARAAFTALTSPHAPGKLALVNAH